MDVPRLALILAVIVQADALEVEPAAVLVQLPAAFPQTLILLLPLHIWRGSAETKQERYVCLEERWGQMVGQNSPGSLALARAAARPSVHTTSLGAIIGSHAAMQMTPSSTRTNPQSQPRSETVSWMQDQHLHRGEPELLVVPARPPCLWRVPSCWYGTRQCPNRWANAHITSTSGICPPAASTDTIIQDILLTCPPWWGGLVV